MNITQFSRQAQKAANFLKSLANANRLMILCYLRQGESCVTDLENKLGIAQSALSQHLARLRKDGFVETRRDGQNIYYSLSDDTAAIFIETLNDLFCAKASPQPRTRRRKS